jgi:hypothetical protein
MIRMLVLVIAWLLRGVQAELQNFSCSKEATQDSNHKVYAKSMNDCTLYEIQSES